MASGTYIHRRPSYADRQRAYPPRARARTNSTRSRSTSDYGVDNYAYDEAHLEKWSIPVYLLVNLPQELHKSAEEWQFAGTAVCTALDRIQKLDDQSLYRGYPSPSMTTHPHLTRRVSNAQPSPANTINGVETPPMSSPESSAPASLTGASSSLLPLERMSSFGAFSARQPVGTESPPITPVDSHECPTPENPRGIPIPANKKPGGPDVQALTRQLSPFSVCGRNHAIALKSSSSAFDESAWDVYINAYKAEMLDLKSDALQRVKGLGGQIGRLIHEYIRLPEYNTVAIKEFQAWWIENKDLVVKWEHRVSEVELPDIEFIRKERSAKGWTT